MKLEHIAEVAGLKAKPVETALRSLANRSLVVPDQEEEAFALVPMVSVQRGVESIQCRDDSLFSRTDRRIAEVA